MEPLAAAAIANRRTSLEDVSRRRASLRESLAARLSSAAEAEAAAVLADLKAAFDAKAADWDAALQSSSALQPALPPLRNVCHIPMFNVSNHLFCNWRLARTWPLIAGRKTGERWRTS